MKIKSPEPNVFEIAFFHIKFSYSNDHCLKYLYLNFKTPLRQSIFHKVGCVFPMVIWSEFRLGKYRDLGNREDARCVTLRDSRTPL